VYILETPLYEVIDKKTETCEYFYNKQDFEAYMVGKHSNSAKYEISYFKGLGSCGREAWDYMINKNPNLVQVTAKNIKDAADKLKMAFGDDSEARKQWLS
jgi:DNA gyrase/topoisomerase IV subunit B